VNPARCSRSGSSSLEEFIWIEDELRSDIGKWLLREYHSLLTERDDIIRIRVTGYIDEPTEPIEGLALSRAQAVIDFMVEELGVDSDFLEAVDGGDMSSIAAYDRTFFRCVNLTIIVRRPPPR
jgi:hypothetical protein